MARQINPMGLTQVRMNLENASPQDVFIGSEIALNLKATSEALTKTLLKVGVPYCLADNRILIVSGGQLRFRFNLMEYSAAKDDICIIPHDAIIEILEVTDDFRCEMLTFVSAFCSFPAQDFRYPVISDAALSSDCRRLLSCIWDVTQRNPRSKETLRLLISALIKMMEESLPSGASSSSKQGGSRKEEVFKAFLSEVNAHYKQHRDAAFYAGQLCISQHYLHSCVSSASGRSVRNWINLAVSQEARFLLKYTDLPISEIAESLNFSSHPFFTRFFKAETGQTPEEYRNG